jgi:hypothetical protein
VCVMVYNRCLCEGGVTYADTESARAEASFSSREMRHIRWEIVFKEFEVSRSGKLQWISNVAFVAALAMPEGSLGMMST